jgi:uncharacterized protein (UPF0276 family)
VPRPLQFPPSPRHPALAATYEGGDPLLLERIFPLVDYLEISPDSISTNSTNSCCLNPSIVAEFKNAGKKKVLVHGVGLSIASADGFSVQYIQLLDQIFSEFDVLWHSEHLAYTTVSGESLGTMISPPRTNEALDLICERVRFLQERYPVPFLLENVIRLLPDCPGEYSEAGFLNSIAKNTGCRLLLDTYNLECDMKNLNFDVEAFLEELDLANVMEMHLAGGVNHKGFQLDVHSRPTNDSTLALAGSILASAPAIEAITYEFLKEAVPHLGHNAIAGELLRIRERLCA